jgi:hypothetical protein
VRRSLLAGVAAGLMAATAAPAPAAAQDDLGGMLATVASAWARGDANTLAAFAAQRGIELEIHGESLGRVSGRKAAAAFRHMFASLETVAVRPNMTSRVTGTDLTAFGELSWELRPRGSMVPARNTVFLGFVREGRAWRISQVRVMR